jgi:hypothetical protein
MLRKNWTGWVIAMSLAAPLAASCGGEEDDGGDTNAMTATLTMTPGSGDDGSAGDDGSGDDDGMMGTTAAPGDDDGQDTMMADDAGACDPPCENGQECVAGQCFGGDDSSGGGSDDAGGCPAGETCQMTGGGGMACLGEPTHCVLPCAAGACPEPLECDAGGACSYNLMMPPAEPSPDWPLPDAMGMCPAGSLAASFAMGFAVCIPECAAAAPQCPAGGVCAVNPMSSGMPC